MKTLMLLAQLIVIDIDQKDLSHPELIKVNYLLDRKNSSVYLKITTPGHEYRSIMPELQYKSSGIFVGDTQCAEVKFLGLQIKPLTQNCKFEVKAMNVSHGDIDPVPRDVFRVFLTTRADR